MQFLPSQWPSHFISSSIILPSPTLFSTTAFFILFYTIIHHIHISSASTRFCSFRCSVQVSAPYNATLHSKHLTGLFPSSFVIAILCFTSFQHNCIFYFFLSILHAPTFSISTSQMLPVIFAHSVVVSKSLHHITLHSTQTTSLISSLGLFPWVYMKCFSSC